MGYTVLLECKECGKKYEVMACRQWQNDYYGKKQRLYCGRKCQTKAQRRFWNSPEERKRRSDRAKGPLNPRWKGGICSVNSCIRSSVAYKDIRREVFRRDKYTCNECGQVGGKLVVHHIEAVRHNLARIMDKTNMITLCEGCHKITDNYLSKALVKR